MKHAGIATTLCLALGIQGVNGAEVPVTSPTAGLVATVSDAGGNLTWSLTYRGIQVVESSPLGVVVNGTNIGSGATFQSTSPYSAHEVFRSRHGVKAFATNHFQGDRIAFHHPESGIACTLNVRTFNDGVAFRYELPAGAAKAISGEESSFGIPLGATVYSQAGTSVYESVYSSTNISLMTAGAVMGPPVVIQLAGNNGFLGLTEAGIGGFGNPYLTKASGGTGRRLQVMYPLNADGSRGVTSAAATNTPWNVVMVASNLNMLLNNDIVESLALAPDPALFPDGAATEWITPGRSVWDWLNPQPGGITAANAKINSYWAAQMGFEYNTIDEGWRSWNGGNPWAQVQEVATYSHALGVKVLFWTASRDLRTQSLRTAFFQQLKAAGVDGFKSDFFDFDSVSASARERVRLQEDILREAAAHQLVVNFHGSTKPTGLFRTYPNLLQVEAVFGKESFVGPTTHVLVPFTRYLAGPADFTPLALQGGLAGGRTKAFEIASFIAMPGPLVTLAERSDVLANSPFALLIRAIPPMWDETIVLGQSALAQTTALARRSGDAWFLAVMNNGTSRSWNIPLTFLAPGVQYQADIIRDASVDLEVGVYQSTNSFTVTAAAGGGVVAWFYPGETNVYQPSPWVAVTNIDFEIPYTLGSLGSGTSVGNAQFTGQRGWSQSTSGGPGAIVASSDSGLYAGGQALGSGDAGNAYIGANTNLMPGRRFQFDILAPSANKAGVAGFVDLNGDGAFSQAETSIAAGVVDVSGAAYFGFRETIAGGTFYSSGVSPDPARWYRVTVLFDDSTRTSAMEVIDLTGGGAAVDLNGAADGNSFTRTWSVAQWRSTTNFVGVAARASTNLRLDNIKVLEPAIPPGGVRLESSFDGAHLQLNWTRGVLLEATNILGPWITNLAESPYEPDMSDPQRFFRVMIP